MINNLQRKTLISSKMRVINRACFDENGPSQLVGVEARTVGNSLNNNTTWLLIIAALAPICRCLPFIQINHFFHFIFDTTCFWWISGLYYSFEWIFTMTFRALFLMFCAKINIPTLQTISPRRSGVSSVSFPADAANFIPRFLLQRLCRIISSDQVFSEKLFFDLTSGKTVI